MANKNKDKDSELEISQKELQDLIETLDPKRNIQDLAASAAEIIASAGFQLNGMIFCPCWMMSIFKRD